MRHIPGHAQKIFHREFQRLQIADIHDPNAVGAVFIGFVHLLPNLWNRYGVDPFIGTRAPDVIKVVIDARSPGTFTFLWGRNTPQVAMVVVRP
ncbi:hypothetical protein D3C77_347430 [compost metagenome]